ncbi:MAG: septum formation inhibitor Maf [Burkholderiaceae bacterium]|nr:septum formation inhibitor Maf [Burkholderiaceae bacterium]MCD6675159.1 Maf family nucleotide pyrophosphatase [Burkholderiaceae bacterium]
MNGAPSQPEEPADFVWLASRSPRRQELLRQIGVRFRLLLSDDDEDDEALEIASPGESPARYVERVARAKAAAARARLLRRGEADAPVLASDTTVAIGGRMYGKPSDADDARRMLRELSGRTHRVLTAVVVATARRERLATQVSRVSFARLRPQEIDEYIAGGEPFGKAGAYAIQGAAARFVRRIEGSHSGIMGLPLYETARLLRGAGSR